MYPLVNATNAHSSANYTSINDALYTNDGSRGYISNIEASDASKIGGKTRKYKSKKRHSRRSKCSSCYLFRLGGSHKKSHKHHKHHKHHKGKKCNCLCHKNKICRLKNCPCVCHKFQKGGLSSVTNPISGYSMPGYAVSSNELALANPAPYRQY